MKAVYTDGNSGQFFNVENLALKYYGNQGWNGLHVENNLMKFLYGVLFWDEIYYPKVAYVF
jgi:Fanconi-associated nuclease 1